MSRKNIILTKLKSIRPKVDIATCVIEDGTITLLILNPHYEDDRNNVIDLEGVEFSAAVDILQQKAHRLGLQTESGTLAFGIAVIIFQELFL